MDTLVQICHHIIVLSSWIAILFQDSPIKIILFPYICQKWVTTDVLISI